MDGYKTTVWTTDEQMFTYHHDRCLGQLFVNEDNNGCLAINTTDTKGGGKIVSHPLCNIVRFITEPS